MLDLQIYWRLCNTMSEGYFYPMTQNIGGLILFNNNIILIYATCEKEATDGSTSTGNLLHWLIFILGEASPLAKQPNGCYI